MLVLPFDQIYIISLKKSIKRRKKLAEHLQTFGGIFTNSEEPPIYFDANDGNHILHSVDNSERLKNRRGRISKSEAGCFASHLAIWNEFLNSDNETILILEDDVRITDRIYPFLSHFSSMPHWDYINFGHITIEQNLKSDLKFIGHPSGLLYSGHGMWLTHAYAINKKAARVFIENCQTQFGSVDYQIAILQKFLKSYGYSPPIFKQEKVSFTFPSTIYHLQ